MWHFYDGGAGTERRIREIREDYALSKIPTRAFEANALYLEVVRLAYNLVTAFQRTCLPQEWQSLTLSKLRHRLFWLPGELTRTAPTYSARSQLSPRRQEWRENPALRSQVKTAGGLKPALRSFDRLLHKFRVQMRTFQANSYERTEFHAGFKCEGSGVPNQTGGDLVHTMAGSELPRVRTELQSC